jgi:Ran GTPase-activating protein (RanGAP) involved in mRNA processing and transport
MWGIRKGNNDKKRRLVVAMKSNTNLKSCNLRERTFDNSFYRDLCFSMSKNPSLGLTKLDFSRNELTYRSIEYVMEFLQSESSVIECLVLEGNTFGDAVAILIAESLLKNDKSRLQRIERRCKIGVKGMQSFAFLLARNRTSLRSLSIGHNEFGNDGVALLAISLFTNTSLQCLKLDSLLRLMEVGIGMTSLFMALGLNGTIRDLDIEGNKIGDEGITELAQSLLTNQSLQTSKLSYVDMSPIGAKALSRSLKSNRTVSAIDLCCNRVGDDGAVALADALLVNQSLQELNLSTNGIGDVGAVALADALRVNQSLQELVLGGKDIGERGSRSLFNALLVNQSLVSFTLVGDENLHNVSHELTKIILMNRSLHYLCISCLLILDDFGIPLANALLVNDSLQIYSCICECTKVQYYALRSRTSFRIQLQ